MMVMRCGGRWYDGKMVVRVCWYDGGEVRW